MQITNLAYLEVFKANNNRLKVIDFTGCPRLKNVEVNGNDIYVFHDSFHYYFAQTICNNVISNNFITNNITTN